MKTIIFHSIKGGVGRTLALNKFAQSLIKMDEKVLLLDFDYSAPGLHYQYDNIPSQDGYIEYLRDTPLKTRISNRYKDQKKCRDSLRNKIVPIEEEKLYLLTAGNDQEVDYWTYISSFSFHRLFYFASKEIAGLSYASFDDQQLIDNIKAFEQDKEYLERTYNFDYLLVDCKSGMETSAVALLLWADKVVHFFPYSEEGYTFAVNTYTAINNYKSYLKFIPVAVRISNIADYKIIQDNFPNIHILSDSNAIPLQETIDNWQSFLIYEYAHLFTTILEKDYQEIITIMNINEDNIYQERRFKYIESQGFLLNHDNKPNISFRVDTFHRIIQSLLQELVNINDINKDSNAELLKRTGQNAASEFIDDFIEDNSNIDDTEELIEIWMKFDSEVGFGTIQLKSFHPNNFSGTIMVIGDAFKTDIKDNQYDLRYIFSGYIETVLKKIFQLDNLNIKFENGIKENETLYKFFKVEEKKI